MAANRETRYISLEFRHYYMQRHETTVPQSVLDIFQQPYQENCDASA
ncbi:MAG: hypothetical protein SAK29_32230 [Scytonema sp. PMC 1069.18]|nr:hypothetical protein [Scytonema sp. PMC 1069.18]MEC4883028.1 hypothetical protein [Scytonema sp. PMC 1070.18]